MTEKKSVARDDGGREERRRLKELAAEVTADFKRRQEERRAIERGWQLNMNFLSGNQYCDVNALGELENREAEYYWQQRRVFNHIAPIVETRCSKLSRIRPKLAVRAASEDEEDRRSAKLASSILNAAYEDCDLDGAVNAATIWSETCGTAFYKIIWDSSDGAEVGKTFDGEAVKEGKAKVIPVSPFEIYPFTLSEEKIQNQPSIIHARAVPVEDIFAAYGVKLAGREIDDFAFSPLSPAGGAGLAGVKITGAAKHGYEVIIERYSRPDSRNPQGRLTIVAGGEVLYDGELPYLNGGSGKRGYPFVKQSGMPRAGGFFGTSVVDRLIPVQRAYNAVKNRKHEFLNRIAMGTVAVEDGSVDTDSLLEDGLMPGKILIYRQGGTPPQMLTLGQVPDGFTEEEEKLESEFYKISGTSDYSQKTQSLYSVTSATGLQLIIEQEELRLSVSYEQIKSALKEIGRHILRLYRQFAPTAMLGRFVGGTDKSSALCFKRGDVSGDDVILEADSDSNLTPAQRRAVVYDMIDKGLFDDDSGKISRTVKDRLLENLGYKGFTGARDIDELHRARCAKENEALKRGEKAEVKDYDDHELHVREHTAFLLGEELGAEEERRVAEHLEQHKIKISEVNNHGQSNA